MKKMTNNFEPHHEQQGFTLVEIMVAITIGLVMMAGILQISAANKESGRLQRNMGFVQENMRSAMELLVRDIRRAGEYIDDNPAARMFDGPMPFLSINAPTKVTTTPITADGGTNENDQVALTYESDTDCLGQLTYDSTDPDAVAGNHFAVNHYFINNQRLMCRGNGGNAEALVEGVEALQILYGENTDGDPRSANRYVHPDAANIANVVSVRVGLRFISRDAIRQTADTNKYALLDADAFTPAANDRLMRRDVTSTIFLRNR